MRMLILGTGGMAKQHAIHFAAIPGVTVVGGVDVDPNRLNTFNTTHNIPNGFASLDAAIATVYAAIDGLADIDAPSQDIVIALAQQLDKDRWFLSSHIAN